MADLQDISEILHLKRGRLEKTVAELGRRQNVITDKISGFDAEKLRISSGLNAQSAKGLSLNENIVFELWCKGMAEKKRKLMGQKLDIETRLESAKSALKEVFVQEDLILARLQHHDRAKAAIRRETEAASRLDLWVNRH